MSQKHHDKENLKRRDFLGGVAAGTAMLGVAGCGSLSRDGRGARDAVDREALLEQMAILDEGLETIAGSSPVTKTVRKMMENRGEDGDMSPEAEEFLQQGDELARKSLRSLLLTGAVLGLSEEARDDPEVQERIERLSPEMDEAVSQTTHMLASCPPGEQAAIQQAIEEHPDLVMRMGEILDEAGSPRGLSDTGRTRLRSASSHIASRLRRQPPSVLFDEYVSKVERLARRQGVEVEARRWIATESTRRTFWGELLDDDGGDLKGGSPFKSPETAEPVAVPESETEPAPPAPRSRDEVIQDHIQNLSALDRSVRVDAIRALAELNADEAIPAMIQTLRNDPDPLVRGWAVRSLHQFDDPRAQEAVRRARTDPDERVVRLAEQLVGPLPRPTTPQVRDRDATAGDREHTGGGRRSGRRIMISGGIVTGVGALTLALGGGLLAAGLFAGAIMLTVGGILLLAGIIVLIIGGARRARERRERHTRS